MGIGGKYTNNDLRYFKAKVKLREIAINQSINQSMF
jgi:hypothetical protein